MTHPAREPTGVAPVHMVSAADQSVWEAKKAGLIMQTIDDADYVGRYVEIDRQPLLNFGSCSYLGLEQRPELKQGGIDAIQRFGTQFSFSRAYLQLPLYEQLESMLGAMTGGYALVAPSTTLAHIAALPVIVEAGDAVIIDQFAHASLQMATGLLRSIPVHPVRHNRMDLLEEKIAGLARTHRRVWYVIDGLYSMMGDFAPLDRIATLLEQYPRLHLYVDDAHSTSWIGKNGRGYALDRLPDQSRVVVALGFAKAFAVGGAALVFPTDEDRLRVRRCGGPMLFSGPLQPPLLGAAVASAKLHLRSDFLGLQQELSDRIDRAHSLASQLGVNFAAKDHTPIFFIRCGATSLTFALARALREQGLYVCISVFPAVPQNQSGVRFTLSLHNTPADIERLIGVLSTEMKRLGISTAGDGHARSTKTDSGVRTALRPSNPPHSTPSSSPSSSPPPVA
jgi:7-keto-8-aminopelargonate synthetase-like enzyme